MVIKHLEKVTGGHMPPKLTFNSLYDEVQVSSENGEWFIDIEEQGWVQGLGCICKVENHRRKFIELIITYFLILY